MNKLLLLAYTICTLSNINNQPHLQDTNTYKYGLPVALDSSLHLAGTMDEHLYSNLYVGHYQWFNNDLTSSDFIASIYDFTAYNFSNDSIGRIYYDITNTSSTLDFDTMRIDINLVIGGYVDTNGVYVDLSTNSNVYYFTSIGSLVGNGEYNYTLNRYYYNSIYRYEITNNGVTSEPTDLRRDYLSTCNNIYIRGFFATGTYQPQKQLDYFLQVGLYYVYGRNVNDNIGNWYNDGKYNDYLHDYSINAFYPYMYLGFKSIDTYYYLQNYGYAQDEQNNLYYSPNNTVIYNGWFKYNNAYYDTLFLNFTVLGNGMETDNVITINNQTFHLTTPQILYAFNALYAYNSQANTIIKILSSDLTEIEDEKFTVTNQYYLHNNTNVITFYNVYWYGTNYNIDNYYNRSYAWYADAYTPEYIIHEQRLNEFLINVVVYRNYLDCLNVKPLGAGNNLGTVTGTIIDGNTNILTNIFDMYGGALDALTNLFGYMIFPGISIGLLLLVPLIVTLIITIVKLFKR